MWKSTEQVTDAKDLTVERKDQAQTRRVSVSPTADEGLVSGVLTTPTVRQNTTRTKNG